MMLVLSGTKDGRLVIHALKEKGYPVIATTVTDYGKILLQETEEVPVLTGGLQPEDLISLLEKEAIDTLIDATHPFARTVSEMAIAVCRELQVRYIRYEREETRINENPDMNETVIKAASFSEAAGLSLDFPGNIFLTIGSNHLPVFCRVLPVERIVARVLPTAAVLKKCEDLGLNPRNIVALQGPFSKELNKELFRAYAADVVVTKDSGRTGGTEEKIAAASELGIKVILVGRPKLEYPLVAHDIAELLQLLAVGGEE